MRGLLLLAEIVCLLCVWWSGFRAYEDHKYANACGNFFISGALFVSSFWLAISG